MISSIIYEVKKVAREKQFSPLGALDFYDFFIMIGIERKEHDFNKPTQ